MKETLSSGRDNEIAPSAVLRTVKIQPPTRPKNLDVRSREYLLEHEVKMMIDAARNVGRHRLRDHALILAAFRHALRVSELIDLRWTQVDFKTAVIHINRLKNGTASVHPIKGDELRLFRRLKKANPHSPFMFVTERGGPLCRSTVSKMVSRAGKLAGLPFPAHPHMLRHAAGYYMANKGIDTRRIQAYLGHRNINHTVVYTQLSAKAFDDIW